MLLCILCTKQRHTQQHKCYTKYGTWFVNGCCVIVCIIISLGQCTNHTYILKPQPCISPYIPADLLFCWLRRRLHASYFAPRLGGMLTHGVTCNMFCIVFFGSWSQMIYCMQRARLSSMRHTLHHPAGLMWYADTWNMRHYFWYLAPDDMLHAANLIFFGWE